MAVAPSTCQDYNLNVTFWICVSWGVVTLHSYWQGRGYNWEGVGYWCVDDHVSVASATGLLPAGNVLIRLSRLNCIKLVGVGGSVGG